MLVLIKISVKTTYRICHFYYIYVIKQNFNFLYLKIKYLKSHEKTEISTQVYLTTWTELLFSLFFKGTFIFFLCKASNIVYFKSIFSISINIIQINTEHYSHQKKRCNKKGSQGTCKMHIPTSGYIIFSLVCKKITSISLR